MTHPPRKSAEHPHAEPLADAYRGNRFAGDLVSWLLFLFFGGVIAAMIYLVVTSMNL